MDGRDTTNCHTAAGKVYIVGAGPGDPELLTIKARRIILEADTVYYDALVSGDLLRGLSARCVFVGKRRGFAMYRQEQINRLLADSALSGQRVVRLKGGDPFVFGRGGEELIYLRERGIDCEVVPGVSAGFAAAASIGAPLTHRGLASSVVLATGSPAARISVPDADTKIFYMAAHSLREVLHAAVAGGLPPCSPVGLVYNASFPDEQRWILPASEIIESKERFPSPLIVIIGPTVEIARSLSSGGVAAGPTAAGTTINGPVAASRRESSGDLRWATTAGGTRRERS